MLMDLFHSCVVTPRKKRVHFNTFMLDIQKSQYHASVTGLFDGILCIFSFYSVLTCPQKLPSIMRAGEAAALFSVAFGPGFVDAGVL